MKGELVPAAAVEILPAEPNPRPGSRELVRYTFEQLQTIAAAAAVAGIYPGFTNAERALTLMLLCQSEGLQPLQALRRYHIINGPEGPRPTLKAAALQAEFQARGGRIHWLKYDDEEARARFVHPTLCPDPGIVITITLDQMSKRGIATTEKNGRVEWKANWRRYPESMLRARCVTQGVRLVMPEIETGIPTTEELEDEAAEPKVIDTPRGAVPIEPPPLRHQPTAPTPAPAAHEPAPRTPPRKPAASGPPPPPEKLPAGPVPPPPNDQLTALEWLGQTCKAANDAWTLDLARFDILPDKEDAQLVKVAQEAFNHLCSAAIANRDEEGNPDPLLTHEAIAKADKPEVRDPRRTKEATEQLYREYPEWFTGEVAHWLENRRQMLWVAVRAKATATAPAKATAPTTTPRPLTDQEARELYGPGANDR